MRIDLRSFGGYRSIDISDLVASFAHQRARATEKYLTINALVGHIRRWEVHPNIPQCCSPEQGITDGMKEDICIGVSFKTLLIRDLHSTEPKIIAITEAVYIVAEACAERYLRHIVT